jgi:regulatory protein
MRKNKPNVPLQDKAVDLIARRRLSRGELHHKLLLRNYPEIQIKEVLDRFEELGYLNDQSLAVDFAQNKIAIHPIGKRRLIWELIKRRVPQDLAELAVEIAFENLNEEDLARKALENLDAKKLNPDAIWRKMANLGFDSHLIANLMSEAGYVTETD